MTEKGLKFAVASVIIVALLRWAVSAIQPVLPYLVGASAIVVLAKVHHHRNNRW